MPDEKQPTPEPKKDTATSALPGKEAIEKATQQAAQDAEKQRLR